MEKTPFSVLDLPPDSDVVTSRTRSHELEPTTKKPIMVAPTLVLLSGETGFAAYITAAAPGVDAEALRLRHGSDIIVIKQLPSFGGLANFRVSLAEGVNDLAAPLRERVQVRARGCQTVELSVIVEAFTVDELKAGNQPEDARARIAG